MPGNNKKIQKIEEIKAEIIPQNNSDESSVIIEPEKLEVKKGGNIIIGSLNIITSPVKKRWEKHYRPQKNKSWYIHLAVDLILAIIILSLIALNFILIRENALIINNQVDLKISTDQKSLISGSNITYLINYQNNSKYKLTDVSLAVQLPDDFVLEKTIPQNMFYDHTNTFALGDIASGGNGQVQISGTLFGEINSQQKITATLDYLPEENSKRKQKITTSKYDINNSNFELEIESPTKVANGQKTDLIIKYSNKSNIDIEKFIIDTNLENNNFKIVTTSYPESNPGIWELPSIPANSSGQISVNGNFITTKDKNKIENIFRLYIKPQNKKLLQQEIKLDTEIVHSKLNLKIKSNNSNITLGEESEYTIVYENKENFDLENIKLNVSSNIDVIEQIKFINDLSSIAKNEKGEVKLKIKTKSKITQETDDAKNFTLELSAQASYNNPQEKNLEVMAISDKLIQKINTALTFYAFARYYTTEGDQLGIGPLPPIVGNETKYWIIFNVENLYNNVSNVFVSANLSDNVYWTGNISTTEDSPVTYNEDSKQIKWQIKEVQAPSTFLPSIGSAFEISFVPKDDQVGQIGNLLENIQITATDNFTSKKITQNSAIITTNLVEDEKENSDGVIKSE